MMRNEVRLMEAAIALAEEVTFPAPHIVCI